MRTIQNILFPTDFSACAEQAFAQAIQVAKAYGATLHVLNIARQQAEDRANPLDYLDASELAALDAAPEGGVRFVHAQESHPTESSGILAYAEAHAIDLVVMGTHGRQGLGRMLLGSVAEAVVRGAPCPVLTVRAGETAVPAIAKILVPIDFSEGSAVVVEQAQQLAARLGAALTLLFVAEARVVPFFSDTGMPTFSYIEPDPEIVAHAGAALHYLARATPSAAALVREGHPAPEIIAVAEEIGAGLVVMSTRGLGGVRGLLGSVADRVIRAAPCPVWTLNPCALASDTEAPTEAAASLG